MRSFLFGFFLVIGFALLGSRSFAVITREDSDIILNRLQELYQREASLLHAELRILSRWADYRVQASARKLIDGTFWVVNVYGGLPRHQLTTTHSFTLAVCHELGHFFGGLPYSGINLYPSEGQADYWGALKCLKKYLLLYPSERVVDVELPSNVRQKCHTIYNSSSEEEQICLRVALSGYQLAQMFLSIKEENNRIDFSTPDPLVVSQTNYSSYPSTQCRLDSYLAAALCPMDPYIDVSDDDWERGVCDLEMFPMGVRPACWFHAK